jgi:hypothetical protein
MVHMNDGVKQASLVSELGFLKSKLIGQKRVKKSLAQARQLEGMD